MRASPRIHGQLIPPNANKAEGVATAGIFKGGGRVKGPGWQRSGEWREGARGAMARGSLKIPTAVSPTALRRRYKNTANEPSRC